MEANAALLLFGVAVMPIVAAVMKKSESCGNWSSDVRSWEKYNGSEFFGAVMSDPAFEYESRLVFKGGKIVEASGHSVRLFVDLGIALNFTPVLSKGSGWSSKEPDGTWTGLLGDLLDCQLDICATQSTFTVDKAEDFHLLPPTYRGLYFVHFRKPERAAYKDVFRRPFGVDVWQMLGVSLCLIMCCNCFFARILRLIHQKILRMELIREGSAREAKVEHPDSMSDSFIIIFALLTQHGIGYSPVSISLRILTICAAVSMLVLYVAYSAQLVSTFTATSPPITSFEELKTKYRLLGDIEVPFVHEIILEKNEVQAEPSNETQTTDETTAKFFLARDEAVTEVMTSNVAFLTIDGFFTSFMKAKKSVREYCKNIGTVVALRTLRWAGMVTRRGWSEQENFGKGLMKIIERGVNNRYERVSSIAAFPNCEMEDQFNVHRSFDIGFDNVSSLFILLGCLYGVAIIICFCETICYRSKHANLMKRIRS